MRERITATGVRGQGRSNAVKEQSNQGSKKPRESESESERGASDELRWFGRHLELPGEEAGREFSFVVYLCPFK